MKLIEVWVAFQDQQATHVQVFVLIACEIACVHFAFNTQTNNLNEHSLIPSLGSD